MLLPEPLVQLRSMMCLPLTFRPLALSSISGAGSVVAVAIFDGFESPIRLDGEMTTIGPGDTYYVRTGVEHGVVALEDGILLDVFTPQREDFLST